MSANFNDEILNKHQQKILSRCARKMTGSRLDLKCFAILSGLSIAEIDQCLCNSENLKETWFDIFMRICRKSTRDAQHNLTFIHENLKEVELSYILDEVMSALNFALIE